MKVKIISSEKDSFWYSDKIGKEYFVEQHDHRNYKVTPNVAGGLIRMYDCSILSHTDVYNGDSSEFIEGYIPTSTMEILIRLSSFLTNPL